jgi:hypothetical protein
MFSQFLVLNTIFVITKFLRQEYAIVSELIQIYINPKINIRVSNKFRRCMNKMVYTTVQHNIKIGNVVWKLFAKRLAAGILNRTVV